MAYTEEQLMRSFGRDATPDAGAAANSDNLRRQALLMARLVQGSAPDGGRATDAAVDALATALAMCLAAINATGVDYAGTVATGDGDPGPGGYGGY